MSIILESRSLTFTAGETKTLGAGSYLGILDASAVVAVELIKNNSTVGNDLSLYKGTAFDLSEDQREARSQGKGQYAFDSVKMTSATAQTVEYVLASGESRDNRLNVLNAVEVINGERATSLRGIAFVGGAVQGSTAGQYSHVQIFNPAASGVKVYVSELIASISGGGVIVVGVYNVALTTLHGKALNKLVGGADSVAEVRGQDDASLLVSAMRIVEAWVTPPITERFEFEQPIVLLEGQGLVFANLTTAQPVRGFFEFHEE